MHQFWYCRSTNPPPPPLSCALFVYFSGKDGYFYPTFYIIGAFLKAAVINFIHPSENALFLIKKILQTSVKARNLKKSRYITKMVGLPALNCIFLIRKNIVHQFGYFRKEPPPLWLVCLSPWKGRIFLPKVLHNWSISQGSTDKFYPPSRERAF